MTDLAQGIHILGTGPIVILLHSSLSSAKQWVTLVNHLKNDFTVINVDILGYGKAANVKGINNYKASVEIERINQALQYLHRADEAYHIVGHSFGGALGLKLAVEEPTKVLSLSLYEPVPFHLIEKNSEAGIILTEHFKQVNVDDLFIAAEAFTDYWNIKGFFKRLPFRMKQTMADEMNKVTLDSMALMAETYGPNEINKIVSPVLIMTGSQSPLLSHVLADIIKGSLDNTKQKVFDAGHMGIISYAQLIQPEIAEFIKEQKVIN